MTTPTYAARISPFAVFRKRSFTLLWFAQLVSTAGSALTSLAAGIYVYRLTQSTLNVSLMLMATVLPSLLVGLVAGVFVDRFDRKKIMIFSDLIRAVLVFLIPFLVQGSLVWLYVIVILASSVQQFFDPAQESLLPEVATDEELAAANSLMAISSFGSTAIGFAASGILAAIDIRWCFYIDAISFLFSAACVYFVKVKTTAPEEETTVSVVLRNLGSGLKFLFGTSILRSVFFVTLIISTSFGLWNALLLPFALSVLNAGESVYGLQEGLTSLAFVAGSLLMAGIAQRLREGQWAAIGAIGMGLVGLLYATASSIPFAIMMVAISGFLNPAYYIAMKLIMQRNTPREMRGRVFSARAVLANVTFLIGMAAAGLADLGDITVMVRSLFIVSALITLGAGVLILVLPGLGVPGADWRRSIAMLRGASTAPSLGTGRAAALADFDALRMHLPILSGLSADERRALLAKAVVTEAPVGTVILRKGDVSDVVYFIIEGRAVAGREEEGKYRLLETLNAGDFFGEIAALIGVPRTANVVAEEPSRLFSIPASTLRRMMGDPVINRMLYSKMTERMVRMKMVEMPRFAGIDQQSLRELRTPEPEVHVE